jgi:hypothetical protein
MKLRITIGASLLVLCGGTSAMTLLAGSSGSSAPRFAQRSDLAAVRNPPLPGPARDEWFARIQIDRSTLQKRDDFTTPDGVRFTVFQGRTGDGAKVCVASAGRGALGGACDTPGFTSSPVLWVEGGSAGPGGIPVTDWELSGLAAPNVARLELVDSRENRRPVHLGKGNAFFVGLSHGELKQGVKAVLLDVYDADGRLLASVAL